MSRLVLRRSQCLCLEQQLRGTKDAGVFRRTLAVLEAGQGRSVSEIAQLVRTTPVSVYHWMERFRRTGNPGCLRDYRGGNRPAFWTDELRAVLRGCLKHPPDYFGYAAVEWTVALLQEYLSHWCDAAPSSDTVRRELHRLEYVWKRPRYMLLPDPEREKKTANLRPNSAISATDGQAVRG